MRQLSVRSRLTGWYAIVLLAGLSLCAAGIWFTLRARLLENIDGELTQRIEGLRTVAQIEGGHMSAAALASEFEEFTREVPDGGWIEVRDHAGAVILPLSHAPIYAEAERKSVSRTITLRGRPVRARYGTFIDRGETYSAIVGTPLDHVDEMMRELRNLTVAIIPAVLLVAGIGGYWLSRRALSPVDRITQVARSISEQNLSARLPISGTGDELERMAQAWNDVLERLESALERIRRFTADASHELRTPIALIRGLSELALRRDRSPDEYRTTMHQIQIHAERMTELTNSLLTLARADAVGPEMALENSNLSRLVEETVQEASAIAARRQIQLDAHLPPAAIWAPVNLPGIRRLLMILIDNALKFTPEAGRVKVSLTADHQAAILAVRDSGPGMQPDVVAHIFERFYQADPARTDAGTGLGLPIAQMIANAHGTNVEVDTAPGQGSTFQVRLKVSPTAGLV